MRASESPYAACRADAIVIGPVGFALTNSTLSRSPPSPSPFSGDAFGPAMKPSSDMDMERTVLLNRFSLQGPAISS